MNIRVELVKELRERTGAGVMACKKALVETNGDLDQAVDHLRRMGISRAARRKDRVAKEGVIESYIHLGGRLGVLVEVNCETDFVARTDDFQSLVRNIAMQIAAANPLAIDRDGLPRELLDKEREFYRSQAINEGKPEKVIDRIVEGKLEKYYREVCLLEQPYIKDPDISVRELILEAMSKLGENISVKRFARFRLGEDADVKAGVQTGGAQG